MSEALKHEIELNEEATRPEDRVPLNQKLAYGMGVVSDHYGNVCLSMFLTAFFVDFIGIGAFIVGLAMGVARLWDAFSDPIVGTLSDKCKSRFGRRKPFIFVGSILTGLCFPLIWMASDGWSMNAITVYLFIALLTFYTLYSIFSVPYEALGTELTPDYKERNSIFVIRSYVQQTFNLGIIWVFPFATWLALKPWVGSNANGVRLVSFLIAAMIIGAGIIPAIFCVERYQKIAEKQEKGTFKDGIRALLKNKPLLIIIGTISFYLFSIIATMNLAYFVNVYYVYGGDVHAGAMLGGIDGTLRFAFSIGGAWAIKKMCDRFDKHHMMMACVALLWVAFVGIYFTTIPGRPWLTLTMKPLLAVGEVGFWVLIMSMRADTCDWDEYNTGTRSEGLIAAITNWCTKSTMTLAVIIAGVFLQFIVQFDSKLDDATMAQVEAQAEVEFASVSESDRAGVESSGKFFTRLSLAFGETADPDLNAWQRFVSAIPNDEIPPVTLESTTTLLKNKAIMDKQSPGTMQRLRVCYTLPQIIALTIAFLLLRKYPLTHQRLNEVRKVLEERRGETIHE